MKKLLVIVFFFTLLQTLNAKEQEVVGEYIGYKKSPRIGYEIMLRINGKEKVFFTFQVNEEVLKKHKNEFVRIKLYDEVLKNVYFNNGNTAIEEYDFATDMDANEKACNNGNAQKCYELAQENAGFLEATGYYNKACEGGHAKACYELAGIYELGNRAVGKDAELSKKFYRMSCKGGYSDACSVVKKLDGRSKNISEKMNSGISSGDLNLKCESDIFYYTRNNNTSMWRKKKNDIKPSFFFKIIDNKNSLMFAMEGRTYNLPKNRVENNTVVYMKSPSSNAYIDINKINSTNNSIIPGVFDVHTNGEVTQIRLKCKSVSAGEIKGKKLTYYDKLNMEFSRLKGLKPIDPQSNVLVADNSAKCVVIGKLFPGSSKITHVSMAESIGYGKFNLSGMTKSVIYFNDRTYKFREHEYENGEIVLDIYEYIVYNKHDNYEKYFQFISRLRGDERTFLLLQTDRKILILECYYTR